MLIPFREIMRQWLYDPIKGYYTQNHVGKSGDFYTSVSVSKFFGGSISRYILRMLDEGRLDLPLYIVEIGSNNGDLISDIAEFIKAFSEVVFRQSTFCTIEPLQTLQALQTSTFENRITSRFQKPLHIYKDICALNEAVKSHSHCNIFFVANELFDSMPCDIVYNNSMLYFHGKQFIWNLPSPEICRFREIYEVGGAEVSLAWDSFTRELCALRCTWVFLTFDYGDFAARDINVRMYKQHKAYNLYEEWKRGNLASFVWHSDITYDVDFSLLCRMFEANGGITLCNVTQSKFLIESCEIIDIFDSFSKHFSGVLLAKQKSSLQGLISPNAMGERFKALCVAKI